MVTLELAPGLLPPGKRVYAIGDVHGCADRLRRMHGLIRADILRRPIGDVTIVHLGDLIDRGVDSAAVLQLLIEPWQAKQPPKVVNLIGNHEDMALAALAGDDPDARLAWMDNGGAATLASWGISPRASSSEQRAAIPTAHISLLESLAVTHAEDGYLFVHAGIRPGVPLKRQSRDDLLWIREPFLNYGGTLPAVIVHGHTPTKRPEIRANRINVDTGAVMGGALTCAALEGNTVGFLRV